MEAIVDGAAVRRRSPQVAAPVRREEVKVRSAQGSHASTHHAVMRSSNFIGWSETSRHARPDSAPSLPGQTSSLRNYDEHDDTDNMFLNI